MIAVLPLHEMNGQQVFLNEMEEHPHNDVDTDDVKEIQEFAPHEITSPVVLS